MKRNDLLAICLAIFSMFLGAGNIIFPPIVGQQAGEFILEGGLGFMAGDIGLTLLTLVGVAMAGGPDKVTRDLPDWASKAFWIALFAVMGPAFVVPRSAHVAYEIGLLPFIDNPGSLTLNLYAVVFLAIAGWFAINPSRLIVSVGKQMAPLLLLMLTVIAVATLWQPQGGIEAATGAYASNAFSEGMVQGYLTMDALGPLCLGWMIAQLLRNHGVRSDRDIVRYSAMVGLFAALGMALVYSALLYLGATSHSVAPAATNGAHILTAYITALFGTSGTLIMGIIITLACLTTAIGTPSACAEYFHTIGPRFTYRQYIIGIYLVAALVATLGLEQLIAVSIPVMVIIYPLAITLTIIGMLRRWIKHPVLVTRLVATTTLVFAALDGWQASGLMPTMLNTWLTDNLPLFAQHMTWLVAAGIALIAGVLYGRMKAPQSNSSIAAEI